MGRMKSSEDTEKGEVCCQVGSVQMQQMQQRGWVQSCTGANMPTGSIRWHGGEQLLGQPAASLQAGRFGGVP